MVVGAVGAAGEAPASTLETTDFLKTWALRKTIHDRERGACFYCLRRTPANVQCLDHVRATRTLRTQFLPQPGFLLYRMQHAQGRPSGPGFSAHALPPGAPHARRTRRTPPRLERSRRRQAPPFFAQIESRNWKIEKNKSKDPRYKSIPG